MSGRLPVLVDMLAQARPSDPDAIDDPAETAVELFLKWETDPTRHAAALACALPLHLNEDIYREAVTEPAPDGYRWLRSLAFVTEQAGRCRYHNVVRGQMLRLQRTRSPIRWTTDHTRLATIFREWRQTQEETLPTDERWDDTGWQDARLHETYHLLCAHPRQALPNAILQLIHACDHGIATIRRWVQMVEDAGHDTEDDLLVSLGQQLHVTTADAETSSTPALTTLLGLPGASTSARALALTIRAREHRHHERYDEALTDYTAALTMDPVLARALAGRGLTYHFMRRYDEALSDYTRAIELDPNDTRALTSRSRTYQSLGRFDEALTDFTRAIELDPNDTWTLTSRGDTYWFLGRFDEALTDFTRAIELDPNDTWTLTSRGDTYWFLGRFDEALTDFTRAIELDPNDTWTLTSRGTTYRSLGRYDEALTDLNRAIQLNPNDAWACHECAVVLSLLGMGSARDQWLRRRFLWTVGSLCCA